MLEHNVDSNLMLSFVFSFRNEEENIRELVRRVSVSVETMRNIEYEMIFVNDNSSDNSLDILVQLQERYPITVVNMSRTFGVTPCLLAGFSYAHGDAIICMDADLQDPPELVPEMVKRFRSGAEVVHTTRRHRDGENPLKMWITKMAYRCINYMSDIELPLNTGDFKLLSSKVVKKILQLKEYDPYMRGLSVWVGFKQDYVYYRREARFGGTAKFPLLSKGPVREFIRGLTAYSATPLYISFFIGLITSIFAVVLVLYAVISKFLGIAAQGSSSVLIAVAFFSGVILTTNGIIGLYISRIYYEVKRRPRYIIDSVLKPGFGGAIEQKTELRP